MKDKQRYFFTVHDELFFDLIVPDESLKTKEKKAKVALTNKTQMFTVHELILWTILVDFKLKNPSNCFAISLSYIHKKYREKRTGKTEVMSKSDLDAYMNALNGLQRKRINLKISNTRVRYHLNHKEITNGRIFKITNITGKQNGDLIFEYTLGEYGEIISKSKRYSDMLPIDILKIPYKQNMKLYIAMYIARLVFINKKRNLNEFIITTESIMKKIRLHDSNGIDIGKTLYELTKENNITKYSKLKLFNNYLNDVLEMLKKNGAIYNYDASLEDGRKCHIDLKIK